MSSSNNNSTIVFSVDATGVEAGVNKIRTGAATINAAMGQMEQRAQLVDAAMKEAAGNGFELNARAAGKLAAEYQRLSATVGKTQAQILEQKAAANGVTSTFAAMGSQIAEASKHTEEMGFKTAGAKRELLVLAHELSQGNFKRFGGSMLVLGERTGAAGLLFSVAGLSALGLAAGVAAAAYEVAKGAEQFEAFNKAIQATGGFIGLNAGQMEDLSAGMMGAGQSLTTVHEAMAQVAATGAFTADNLRLATTAALDMSTDIGIGTDKAAESLAKIQDNVTEWVTSYQKAHHTFSAAQIEEIENFVKMGDTGSAVKAVMIDLANAHDKIAADADKNMGSVITWWHQWGDTIDRVKAGILGIGVADSVSKQIGDQLATVQGAQRNLAQQQSMGMMGNVTMAQEQLATETKKLSVLRDQQAVTFQTQKASQQSALGGDATVRANSFIGSHKYDTPGEQHKQALDENAAEFAKGTKDLDKNGALYADALKKNLDNITQINATYAKKTHGKSPNEDGINAQIKALNAQTDHLKAVYQQQNDAAKASYATGAIDAQTFIALQLQYQEQELAGEAAVAQKQADIAKGKKQTVAMTEYLNTVKKIYGEMDSAASKAATGILAANQKQADAIAKFATEQNSKTKAQQQGFDDSGATQGMTSDDATKYQAKTNLYRAYARTMEQLEAQHNANEISLGVYDSDKNVATSAYADQLQQLQQHQASQLAAQNDYYTQVKNAMTQSTGNAQTNAQLMGTAFSSAYSTMSSQLETFITTGKGSWESFTESIISDFAKIALKAAEQQVFSSVMSGVSMFSTGGAVHAYTGGSIVGAGSGTSDSIPAMLSNGEYVIQASSVKKYGSLLDSMNNGTAHFASGGAVGTVAPSSGGSNTNLSLSLSAGNSGMTQADLAAIAPHIQTLIDKRMNQRMSQQGGFADLIRQGKI
jgi:lambda family phage tail tape measure protein